MLIYIHKVPLLLTVEASVMKRSLVAIPICLLVGCAQQGADDPSSSSASHLEQTASGGSTGASGNTPHTFQVSPGAYNATAEPDGLVLGVWAKNLPATFVIPPHMALSLSSTYKDQTDFTLKINGKPVTFSAAATTWVGGVAQGFSSSVPSSSFYLTAGETEATYTVDFQEGNPGVPHTFSLTVNGLKLGDDTTMSNYRCLVGAACSAGYDPDTDTTYRATDGTSLKCSADVPTLLGPAIGKCKP
jgi:hypothetical protein